MVTHGRLEIEGRLLEASNATLYCGIEFEGATAHAVYKPVAGERPLWDFRDGTLAGREVATYLISRAADLGTVPPTVLREGPLGVGMVQLWVEVSGDELVDVMRPQDVPGDWLRVLAAHDRFGEPAILAHADRADVRDLAVLDAVVNNTDRKGGHVLHGVDGRAYGVDHGICLHPDPKLRTVLWGWAGQALPSDSVERLRKLRADVDGQLGEKLGAHLTAAEVRALGDRISALLADGVFPEPDEHVRSIPWPLF
ncbi:MAG: SCO1664 family protein [Haloechinothrix sp.]